MANDPARVTRAQKRWQTESRILAAAREGFARSGYERTTIRAVAESARVDPGLVMHYFNSKEELFLKATAVSGDETVSGTSADVAEALLASLADRLVTEPTASLALLRSMLTHEQAKEGVRRVTAGQLEQISRSIDSDDAELRGSLLSATILGIILGRHLLELDGLKDAPPHQIIELLQPVVRGLAAAERNPENPQDSAGPGATGNSGATENPAS
ncbi:TetR/AcrR family transcriptional regulator [Streptomyces sp. NRRL F-5126]|uniref:TetR/AcrR family transcriptional regulator n=1 Tax=Streptomyces sp. NRRL F-5126 TaxID=1463857 RepID=UPI00099BB0E4|nr:TetR/AcrR family transcriptional regulator [Streptomyces sp. NRRL F-5126]